MEPVANRWRSEFFDAFPLLDLHLQKLTGTVFLMILIISFAGNLLIVFWYGRSQLSRKHQFFTIALAISQGCQPICGLWMLVASCFNGSWPFGAYGCYYYGFIQSFTSLYAIVVQVVISGERCMAITRPFRLRKVTLKQKIGVAFGVAIYSVALSLPPLFGWGKYHLDGFRLDCCFNFVDHDMNTKTFIIYLFTFGLFVPSIAMIGAYGKTFYVFWAKERGAYAEHDESTQEEPSISLSVISKAGDKSKTTENTRKGNSMSRCKSEQSGLASIGSGDESDGGKLSRSGSTRSSRKTAIRKHAPVTSKQSLKRLGSFKLKDTSQQFQLAITSLLCVIAFMIAWLPYSIVALAAQFGDPSFVTPLVTITCGYFAKASIIYNPFIYGFRDEKLRRGIAGYMAEMLAPLLAPCFACKCRRRSERKH